MRIQMFPCPYCEAEFDSLESLEYHLRAMHRDAVPCDSYRCVTCHAEFMSHMAWLDHMRNCNRNEARVCDLPATNGRPSCESRLWD